MNIAFKVVNTTLTPALRDYATRKLEAMQKFLPQIRQAQVVLAVDPKHQSGDVNQVDITLYVKREVFRGEETADDMYAAIDLVIPKIKRQAERYADKIKSRRHRDKEGLLQTLAEWWQDLQSAPPERPQIVKRKRFSLVKPMSEVEAIEQMNLLEHAFFLFNNSETGRFSVVYRRDDGNYGLIEPDNE